MRLPCPVGVNSTFVAPYPVTLVIEERRGVSARAKELDVKDIQGNVVLRCKGSVHGDEKCKNFFGPAHDLLYTLRKTTCPIPRTWCLVGPMNERFLEISKQGTFSKTRLEAEFKNVLAGGYQTVLEMHGDLAKRQADVLWDGRPIARVRQEFFRGRELFQNRQTYGLEVEAGADIALIVAIVLSLDEFSTKVG